MDKYQKTVDNLLVSIGTRKNKQQNNRYRNRSDMIQVTFWNSLEKEPVNMSCMSLEQFLDVISRYESAIEVGNFVPQKDSIHVSDIPQSDSNRTLIRGTYLDGREFHLFIKDGTLYRVVTHRFGLNSTIQSGDAVLSEPLSISDVFSLESAIPDLVLGDSTDYEFTLYLLEHGIILPMDYWSHEGFLRRRMFSVLGHGDYNNPSAAYRGRTDDFDKCGYYPSNVNVERALRPRDVCSKHVDKTSNLTYS